MMRTTIAALLLLGSTALPAADKTRILICGDDGGGALSFNLGTIESYQKGVMRCANLLVAGPWFLDMAKRVNENPGIGGGVHLDLTSEWDGVKWRPLTGPSTLTDEDGYLPPNFAAWRTKKPTAADMERELRAQIEMAKKHIRNLGWLWGHMGVTSASPEMKEIAPRLAKEYGLPLLDNGALQILRLQRGQTLADALEKLGPGDWFFIEHPSLDTPESRAIGHKGNDDVAVKRQEVVRTWTDPEIRKILERRGIELLTPELTVKLLKNHL